MTSSFEPAAQNWAWVVRVCLTRHLGSVALSLLVCALLPALWGWSPRVVMTGSMAPGIAVGDIVVTRPVEAHELRLGQVVTVEDPDAVSGYATRTHRLVEIRPDGRLLLKGDANADRDSTAVSWRDVRGVGVVRVPWVGRPFVWAAHGHWTAVAVTSLLAAWLLHEAIGRRPLRPAPRRRRTTRRAVRRRLLVAGLALVATTFVATSRPADAAFTSATGASTSRVQAGPDFYPYRSAVLADAPLLYWRMEPTAGTVPDTSGGLLGGTAGFVRGTWSSTSTGPLASEPRDKALSLSGGSVTSVGSLASPLAFSVEAWVRTSSSAGGPVLGLSDSSTAAASLVTDRQLYLSSTGRVVFGAGSPRSVVTSPAAVNDGAWHHLVGTYSSGTGLMLYVDGVRVGTGTATPLSLVGFWRAGAENLSGWPSAPAGATLAGDVDEVAVFDHVLSAARVSTHFRTGVTP